MKEFGFNQNGHSLTGIEVHKENTIAHIGKGPTKNEAEQFPTLPAEFLEIEIPIDTSNLFEEVSEKLTAEDGPFSTATEEYTSPIDEMQNLLDEVTSILTDEQADQIPQAFSEGKAGVAYSIGQRVRYNDKLGRCVQAHTSQEGGEPSETPSLGTHTHQEGEIPEWTQPLGATDAYSTGDKVKYSDKIGESTVDNNVGEPGVYGGTEVTK